MFLLEHPYVGGSCNVHMMRPIPIQPIVPVSGRSYPVGGSRALLRVADPRQTIPSVERYRP